MDVIGLIRDLNVPIVRYPGGNFVSGYDWGRRHRPQRPASAVLELDYTIEPNLFGTDDFVDWCRAFTLRRRCWPSTSVAPEAACDIIEYRQPPRRHAVGATSASPTAMPTRTTSRSAPGQRDGRPVADRTQDRRRARPPRPRNRQGDEAVDPSINCGAVPTATCPPSRRGKPPSSITPTSRWNTSLHTYHGNHTNNTPNFLAKSIDMDRFYSSVVGIRDYIQAKKRSKKKMMLVRREWNVWYHLRRRRLPCIRGRSPCPSSKTSTTSLRTRCWWAWMLIMLLANLGIAKMACQAQLVNVIAPIMTVNNGPAWRQTIYHPFTTTPPATASPWILTLSSPVYDDAESGRRPLRRRLCGHVERRRFTS
ncbi:MAG: alpha-L-arabinofuranosidase C-terminal domain-containing protein [Caldilineaceae bacterium]